MSQTDSPPELSEDYLEQLVQGQPPSPPRMMQKYLNSPLFEGEAQVMVVEPDRQHPTPSAIVVSSY